MSLHDQRFVWTCTFMVLMGSVAVVAGNVVGTIMVPDHDWVADTISDLAAGEWEIIQDVGLYGFSVALVAAALGSAYVRQQDSLWNLGIACLVILSAIVIIIGARNEYGDRDHAGVEIHRYLVYALGVLAVVLPLLMGRGLGRLRPAYKWLSYLCAGVWAFGVPVFLFAPTGIDGLIERLLLLVALVWIIGVALALPPLCRREDQGRS